MASAAPLTTRPDLRRLDALLVALVLVLAFLASCTPVRNSDFWMHLASGRLLAHGNFSFGDDPFVYTTTSPWVNHAWLFDLALYALYQTVGGVGLVLAKALLVVGMAEMLCRIRQTGSPVWLSACGAGFAVVASAGSGDLFPFRR